MASVSGHVQVREGARGRVWVALWRDAERRHKRVLGPAWVKPHGTTPRGATKWRAADRPRPDGDLTPKEADAELRGILAGAPRERPARRTRHTFAEACDEWLRYVEHDRERRPSTVRDYRNTVRRYLLLHFGPATPVGRLTTDDIDAYREGLLEDGRLSRRTIQKILVLLHGILKRAKREKWIATNPAEDAERITLKRSGDFNVLSPAEIEAVARAPATSRTRRSSSRLPTPACAWASCGRCAGQTWTSPASGSSFGRASPVGKRGGQSRAASASSRWSTRSPAPSTRRDLFTGPEDLVLPSEVGRFFDDSRLRLRFYDALRDAGLGRLREKEDRFVFHDLRHTFGTLAVRGFPLSDVKAFMGHESIETTMIYVHHIPQTDAAARLSALLNAEAAPPAPAHAGR